MTKNKISSDERRSITNYADRLLSRFRHKLEKQSEQVSQAHFKAAMSKQGRKK